MLTKLFLCAVLTVSTMALKAQRNQQQEIKMDSQSLAGKSIRSVEASTEGGNISVEGVQDGEARVVMIAWGRGDEATIRQRYNDIYHVTVKADNGKLTVSATRKKQNMRDRNDVSASFRIYVPVSASTDLNTSGGNIQCKKLTGGKQRVETSGGNISFNDVKGDVNGRTSGGNIAVSHCSENFDLFTSGGNIHATQSNGKFLLSTSGGNISLDAMDGTIEAKTSGGNVGANSIEGSLTTSSSGGNLHLQDLSCAVDAGTSGGNLHVTLRKVGAYVKLHNNGSGHTLLEVPGNTGMNIRANGRTVEVPRGASFRGDVSEREVNGSLNGGGIPVSIEGGDSKVVVKVR